MSRDPALRLEDILEAAVAVEGYILARRCLRPGKTRR
jgi:hypothetical protein